MFIASTEYKIDLKASNSSELGRLSVCIFTMAMVKGEKSYEEEVIIVNGYNVTCGFNDIRSYRLWK